MNNNRNERRKTNIVSLHSAINNELFGFHNNDLKKDLCISSKKSDQNVERDIIDWAIFD